MIRRITLPVLLRNIIGCGLLLGTGCVSQQTYDTARTEADELTRALEAARTETRAMEQEVAALKLRNAQEDAAVAEVRAAIRQVRDAAPMLRQRADDTLAALQTQVAYMMNQNRLLGREIADAKQERVSLRALMAQYKQELDEASQSVVSPAASALQSGVDHRITPSLPTPTPSVPTFTPPAVTAAPAVAPPSLPAKVATVPRPTKATPAQSEESWTGMIKGWASSLWDWIFS